MNNGIQELSLSLVVEYDLTQSRSVNSSRPILQNNIVPKCRDDLSVGGSSWFDDTSCENVCIDYGDAMGRNQVGDCGFSRRYTTCESNN